jgi:MoxR-like ATPase
MADTGPGDWIQRNQRALIEELGGIRDALERHVAANPTPSGSGPRPLRRLGAAAGPRDLPVGATPDEPAEPAALDALAGLFGLSPFERATLVLCAGVELDATMPALCAQASGSDERAYPTFSLALAALPDAHWSALSPGAPLRHWRLVELLQQPPLPMTSWPLRIDERVLHYLTGVNSLDERLIGAVLPVAVERGMASVHHDLAHRVAASLSVEGEVLPAVLLNGATEPSRRAVAAAVWADLDLGLWALDTSAIPAASHELEGFVRLWDREAALGSLALYVDVEAVDAGDSTAVANVVHLVERTRAPIVVGAREPWRALRRRSVVIDVPRPSRADQRAIWMASFGSARSTMAGRIDAIVAQFDLDAPAIRGAARDAIASRMDGDSVEDAIWSASRRAARTGLDGLAQRLESLATWDDLVLPATQRRQLEEIVEQVANRTMVYEQWGFGERGSRGLGISALFVGASGTGKTMSAEVLASEIQLDLFRIDLSSVVSKYIGETEKNLRRVFDAAEAGGAILFFDEADALFGKRSEVKDSHDRYANIEVNYLLQRMESYRGVAILATNMKGALDAAFLRRIRFVVNFPMPDAAQRSEIWQKSFPPATPTQELDIAALSRLDVAGGNIRNIALNAAFLAASAGTPVRMEHVARATRAEFGKLDRPMPDALIGGWS